MRVKFCPKCGNKQIDLFVGGKAGTIFECKKCGFRGVLFPEKEIKVNKKKKTKIKKK